MNTIIIKGILIGFTSFIITFLLTPLCSALAKKINFIDIPDGKIKSHKEAVPYLGGLAVYCGFLLSCVIISPLSMKELYMFFLGATLLFCIGLIDDFLVCSALQKFIAQIIAALLFIVGECYLYISYIGTQCSIVLSIFWILSITNAFNLIDVMDGLASLVGIGVAGSLVCMSFYSNNTTATTILMGLIGSLCAFFIYNKPPAKIYLGDAGSLFVGGSLAAISLISLDYQVCNEYFYLIPLIIFAVPALEICTLIVIRTYKKIPFYQGSPDHFSHYLQRNKWSKHAILIYIGILSIIQLAISIMLVVKIMNFSLFLLAVVLLLMVWFFCLLYGKKLYFIENE